MAASTPQVKPATATINQQKPQAPKRDVTILSQPAHAARQGISQIFDVLLSGTPYMRQLLLHEADVIYECKACRSLFRGLINFVDHKKNFCTLRVGSENAATAQSTTTGLQRYMCQDKEPVPIIIPESPDEENDPKVGNIKKGSTPSTPKQQLVIRKPDATYVLVRPIPGTTKAMEQMLIKPDQIIHQSHLDMLSNFKTSRHEADGTTKLVGEIAIKQAQKVATSTSPKLEDDSPNEKRKTLHDLLTKVKVSSSYVNMVSAGSPPTSPLKSKGSSKQLLMVTLGQQKKMASKQAQQNAAKKKKAVCKTCKKECVNFTALAWHERMHKKPNFKCAICGAEARSLYNLKRHLLNVHHLTRTKVESMMKVREQKLKLQVKDIGKQPAKDDDDDDESEEESESESSSESSSSEEDEEEEAGADTPTCPVCQKTFASKRNVNRHLKIHQREGQLPTSNNNKKLSSEQIAKKRVQAIIDEKKLKCRKCGKVLSGIRRLQQHCCNHFKLNRYRCSLCPYENSDYTQMRRHVMGKHGRQFRSINQISDAIRQMKVGLWVNLRKSDSGDEEVSQPAKKLKTTEGRRNSEDSIKKVDATTTKKSEISHREFASKKSHSKPDNDKTGESDKPQVAKIQPAKISMPTIVFERASRSRDSSIDRSVDSSSIPNTPPKLTPIKRDLQDNESKTSLEVITLRNSSRSASPASARVKIEQDSPKRDTPIRQARLNHRNISSNIAQNLNLSNGDDDNVDSRSEKVEMLMDRRLIRCIDCNKRFTHMSSLRRHVHNHLREQEASSGNRPARSNRVDENDKAKSIDDFINVSQLKCTKCHKRFDTMSALKHHVARHLGYSTYKCRYCKYISRNYTWFKKHLQLSHPNVVKNVSAFGSLMSSMRVMMK